MEPLFEYYDMPLHGMVVSNREEPEEQEEPVEEPVLPLLQ